MNSIHVIVTIIAVLLFTAACLNAQIEYHGTRISQVLNKWDSFYDAVIQGNYAYLVMNAGVSIVDISDPSIPHEVGFYSSGDFHPQCIAISGNHLYLGNGSVFVDVQPHVCFSIVDVSNPLSPVWVNNVYEEHQNAISIQIIGNHAFVTTEGQNYNKIVIFDVSNPEVPVEVSQITIHSYYVTVSGNHIFLIDKVLGQSYRLLVYNISDMQNPQLVSTYPLNTYQAYNGIDIEGVYLYLSHGTDMQVISISNPAAPFLVSSLATNNCIDVKVLSNFAYINDENHLHIVDVHSPFSPTIISSYDSLLVGFGSRIAVAQNYVYFSGNNGQRLGINIIDVTDPNDIFRTGNHYQKGKIVDVEVEGDRAYVLDREVGMHVLDIQNPAVPVELGCYNIDDQYPMSLTVAGNYALVTTVNFSGTGSWTVIRLLDVSNPAQPFLTSNYIVQGIIGKPTMIDNYLYVSNDLLYVINIADPYHPYLECTIGYPNGAF
ncbi:MAG: hypothetical protein R6V77_01225 [Candidatus Cloacimonadaceae bacterium]